MHHHHKSALLKARADYRKARNSANLSADRLQVAKDRLFELASIYGWSNPGVDTRVRLVRDLVQLHTIALQQQIAAGEILVCVERMLEKA